MTLSDKIFMSYIPIVLSFPCTLAANDNFYVAADSSSVLADTENIEMVPSFPPENESNDTISKFQYDIYWINEGQMNLSNGKSNVVNYLSFTANWQLSGIVAFNMGVLGVDNIRIRQQKSWCVADDAQVFSNITINNNHPFLISQLGLDFSISNRFGLFVGVRNMNIDYFIGDYTSLFTNSSNGIYPTISDNFIVPNYPTAAFCLHGTLALKSGFVLKNSFYNGMSYSRLDKVFRISPKYDGFLNVSQLSYNQRYNLGFVYAKNPTNMTNNKRRNWSLYTLVEQPVTFNKTEFGFLLQGGYAPKSLNNTYLYYGAGIILKNIFQNDFTLGVQFNRAFYKNTDAENDIELTCRLPITSHITIQTAIHLLNLGGSHSTATLLRFQVAV
jgi:hypothetical protein